MWTSPDGTSWSRVPHDPVVFGGAGHQQIESVVAGGPGLVAVGMRFDEPGLPGLNAAVWTSPDGIAWSPVPRDKSVFGTHDPNEFGNGKTWMHDVSVGGPGLVAVGEDDWSAAVWTSPDGITWSRVPHEPEIFGEGTTWESHSEMHSVTAGGPGLVAVGNDDGYSQAAVWIYREGVTWTRVPHDEAVFGGVGGQGMRDVIARGPGLVAVGQDEPDRFAAVGWIRAAVWTSPDGYTWTRVAHDPAIFGEGEDERMMRAVTVGGPGLVAVGTDVWTSPDGLTWSWVPQDVEVFGGAALGEAEVWGMRSVTSGGPGLVAVGSVQ